MYRAENGEKERLENVFRRLSRSRFRSGVRLNAKETSYLRQKGLPEVLLHGRDFLEKRLAPALPPNDGKQTPWGGHPVFRAQHATATCCRSCLLKWHGIPKKRKLTEQEIDYILLVIEMWLSVQSAPQE
ncbi:MAG: DUF4186 domain-containing protein [Candidatus Dadabacteria bacterium]|nr:DUF4186 domain-containing protein [Candidatus Dadabacteria bacterium]MDE0477359.1 DUF4186 domain-containing protein [Candidatus Dadabacteria bacterium]